ncbi:MAG: phosphoribosylaminoimidazolesuccinocarboxamide synthase [Bacteroidetes bacterium]|jgi:phosphoribosylaminoimidazole-succinocarboxamide synthase|nr:phosphoribosylaminoimidazolesuccinocarboxamide synthase [Bacteroidota bacterium]
MSAVPSALAKSNLSFPKRFNRYQGKVRDVYDLGDHILMVATDRISAFDHILPKAIPYKGQILNSIARQFLVESTSIVPNWLESDYDIDPAVSYGSKAEPIRIEMVIRGYCVGHAWREFRLGQRSLCGVPLPEGLSEGDAFPKPIITPSTKAEKGHDEDISREEIMHQGILSAATYKKLEEYTRALFEWGQEKAKARGLILADTKYEFGIDAQGDIILIDEIHTPDSSRYFYAENYDELRSSGKRPKQLSKEFVREWLISEGFQGKEGQEFPEMSDQVVASITERYMELYETLMGYPFTPAVGELPANDRIQKAVDSKLIPHL